MTRSQVAITQPVTAHITPPPPGHAVELVRGEVGHVLGPPRGAGEGVGGVLAALPHPAGHPPRRAPTSTARTAAPSTDERRGAPVAASDGVEQGSQAGEPDEDGGEHGGGDVRRGAG